MEMPAPPAGTGKHPITLVVISANDLAASSTFYASLFGWQMMKMSAELTGVATPAGPSVALRANIPEGFPGIVPYLGVANVEDTLKRVTESGGRVERAPWNVPMMGTLARFKDVSGTVYGVSDAVARDGAPSIPMPFGSNPKPPAGAICSLEMYAVDGATPRFFGDFFGWGTMPTMPQFVAFDPGAGIGGVFQSHTPTLPAVAYLYVADVASTLKSIEGNGGQRQGDAMSMPGMGTFGYFKDPSGTTMGLIGP